MNRLINFQQIASSRGNRIGTIAGAVMALLAPFLVVESILAQTYPGRNLSTQNVTIDDIVDNPAAYAGRLVTVRSDAENTDGRYSFRLDDTDGLNIFGLDFDDDELLVFNTTGVAFNLPEDDTQVQVMGVVRPFIRAEVERQLGIALDPNIYADYEYQPAIFAQSLAYAPSPGEVTDAPQDFYGRAIAVEGSIDNVYSPYAFSLNDPDLFAGEDLLVINASPTNLLQEDEDVVVVGELRPYVTADIERNYNMGVDLGLPGDLETEFERRPVLIVREVYPSTQ